MPNWKNFILKISFIILIICIIHNLLFQFGFFGGSTYAYFDNEKVRILKVRNQKAFISKTFEKGIIVYSHRKNDRWVNLKELHF